MSARPSMSDPLSIDIECDQNPGGMSDQRRIDLMSMRVRIVRAKAKMQIGKLIACMRWKEVLATDCL